MNALKIYHSKENSTTYKLIEGNKSMPIAYNIATNDKIIKALEHCRKNRIRITLDYGDVKTNKSWEELHYVKGYIGLSKGYEAYFPILVYNSRSLGGSLIMDDCILSIKTTKGKKIIYKQ